jgi:hypothetical protein
MNDYNEMTNAALLEIVEAANIKVNAKNPQKPNKAELVEAITKHQEKATEAKKERDDDVVPIPAEAKSKLKPGVTLREKTKLQLIKEDLMLKDRVIIHDNQENQTKEDTITVSWGSRGIGTHTDLVSLTGEPQYVRRGALNNLRTAKAVIQTPKEKGGVSTEYRNRFVIQEVKGLTEKELAELAAVQRMRNSKQA